VNPKLLMKESKKNFFSLRKKEKDKVRFGFASTYVTMITLITILLLYYIVSLNTNATKGYTMIKLEQTQRQLEVELEKLDVKIAELDSLDTILKDSSIGTMEKVEDPDYLVIREGIQYVYKN
jgi:hypothetical protein